jgi:ankyrin repeat protein
MGAVTIMLLLAALACTAGAAKYPLHDAIANLDVKTVKSLVLSKKANINGRDSTGQTPLHVAMLSNGHVYWDPFLQPQYDIIKFLLSKGANPNVPFPDYAGLTRYTVLHYAAFDGNMALVPLMVAAKANIRAKDERGFTPLHSAARCDFRLSCDDCTSKSKSPQALWKQGALPTIRYLLSKGANILVKTKAGETVLDIVKASKLNCPKTYKYVAAKTAAAKKRG